MKTTAMMKLAASTMILGVTMVGCSPSTQARHLGNASDTRAGKTASKAAVAGTKALAARDFVGAVAFAETAVAALPNDAGYRMLLGQAYLGAGRFSSAETAFSETLTLLPDQGRAALNLALVQIALGKNSAALTTLADYRDRIGASDCGLALALAGDTDGGVRTLEGAVRDARADAKARQNLALAYALAGKWNKAHVTAAQDLAPADADARIIQWGGLCKAGERGGRVAALLGVQAVSDAGQPMRLALAPVADIPAKVAKAQADVDASRCGRGGHADRGYAAGSFRDCPGRGLRFGSGCRAGRWPDDLCSRGTRQAADSDVAASKRKYGSRFENFQPRRRQWQVRRSTRRFRECVGIARCLEARRPAFRAA